VVRLSGKYTGARANSRDAMMAMMARPRAQRATAPRTFGARPNRP
jgi:hypothetical protein